LSWPQRIAGPKIQLAGTTTGRQKFPQAVAGLFHTVAFEDLLELGGIHVNFSLHARRAAGSACQGGFAEGRLKSRVNA
jgi:hypothetical protein